MILQEQLQLKVKNDELTQAVQDLMKRNAELETTVAGLLKAKQDDSVEVSEQEPNDES